MAVAGFNSDLVLQHCEYSQTIFRLPLRTEASGLSDNTYDTQKLLELLDALREEANNLLLFLKSVCKIEIVHILQDGEQSCLFCVEIDPDSLTTVSDKRASFKQQLSQAHALQPYGITNVISFTAIFSVVMTDHNLQAGTICSRSTWLTANCVGSADPSVQAAAAKQRIFPWVGTALELGDSSAGGRIFCFLPMPVETSSCLPVHINGTFGLNDDRRTLKWPGTERRNDDTANWNKILVSRLLPPCYAMLLTEAKNHLTPDQFYKAWPDVRVVQDTQFSEILSPLLAVLFNQAIVWTEIVERSDDWTEEMGAPDNNWIRVTDATFISEDSSLPKVMREKVLPSGSVQLVTVPSEIWQAIQYANIDITVISPELARLKLRRQSCQLL